MGSQRVIITARVAPHIKRKLLHIKADTNIDMEDVVEVAVRVVLAVVEAAKVPDDLGRLLAERDPEALERLGEIVARVRALRAEAAASA